jgi:hypothetical protein
LRQYWPEIHHRLSGAWCAQESRFGYRARQLTGKGKNMESAELRDICIAAIAAATVTEGRHKGQLLAKCPAMGTDAAAAWQALMGYIDDAIKGHELQKHWRERCKLRAEGRKLRAEGSKLRREADKLYAEANKLYAKGEKLLAEGDVLWANAVLERYGNIGMKWDNGDCVLENGDRYRADEPL